MVLNDLARSFGIGAAAGLRSMTAPAATLAGADSHWTGPARLAAAGEMVVDKLPVAPPRLMPVALAVRVLSGAFCGRVLAKRAAGSQALGTVAGAVGAFVASYGGYYARQYVTVHQRAPDLPVALVEDALALGLARASVRPNSRG